MKVILKLLQKHALRFEAAAKSVLFIRVLTMHGFLKKST